MQGKKKHFLEPKDVYLDSRETLNSITSEEDTEVLKNEP
jgi:hypothetical protein